MIRDYEIKAFGLNNECAHSRPVLCSKHPLSRSPDPQNAHRWRK